MFRCENRQRRNLSPTVQLLEGRILLDGGGGTTPSPLPGDVGNPDNPQDPILDPPPPAPPPGSGTN